MKQNDAALNVMRKVVRLERRRSFSWLGKFVVVILALMVIGGGIIILAVREVVELGTLDLLTLFQEDAEIVRDYWRETLATIFQELPFAKIVAAGVIVLLMAVIIILSQKKLKTIIKRVRETATFGEK